MANSDPRNRSFYIQVPKNLGRAAPLLIALHAQGFTADSRSASHLRCYKLCGTRFSHSCPAQWCCALTRGVEYHTCWVWLVSNCVYATHGRGHKATRVLGLCFNDIREWSCMFRSICTKFIKILEVCEKCPPFAKTMLDFSRSYSFGAASFHINGFQFPVMFTASIRQMLRLCQCTWLWHLRRSPRRLRLHQGGWKLKRWGKKTHCCHDVVLLLVSIHNSYVYKHSESFWLWFQYSTLTVEYMLYDILQNRYSTYMMEVCRMPKTADRDIEEQCRDADIYNHMCSYISYTYTTDRQTHSQTHSQPDRQTDRQTDTQPDAASQPARQTDRHTTDIHPVHTIRAYPSERGGTPTIYIRFLFTLL